MTTKLFLTVQNKAVVFFCTIIPVLTHAQTRLLLVKDTVKVVSAELKINNSTKDVQGFLYNTGNGVTQFKPVAPAIDSLWKQGDSLYYKKGNFTGQLQLGSVGLADPGANGIPVRTAVNTTIARTITGKPGYIEIANGDGVNGNPVISTGDSVVTIAGNQTLSGKTISGSANTITNISNAALTNNSFNVALGKSGTGPNWSAATFSLGGTNTLNLPDAGIGISQGLVNNTAQTFDGIKTFNGTVNAIGGFQTSDVTSNSNWGALPSGGLTTNFYALLIGSGSSVGWRRFARGSTAYTAQTGYDYGGTIFGTEVVNIASAGTHSIFATVAINPLTIGASSGSGVLTNSATLFIKGAATGAVNNYSIWSAGGNIRFDLGGDAAGDLLYRSPGSGGALARLAIGSAGQFLGVSGGVPAWLNIADNFQSLRSVDESSNTSYTLAISDRDKTKIFTGSIAKVVTIPPYSSVAIPVNTEFELIQYGTGELSVAAGSGVTILSPGSKLKASQQYSVIRIKKTATDTWLLSGDLKL